MDVSFNKPIPEVDSSMPKVGRLTKRYEAEPGYGYCVLERIPVNSVIHISGQATEDIRWRIVKLGSSEFSSAAGVIPFKWKPGDEVLLDVNVRGGELGGDPKRIICMMNYVIARVPPGGDDG